MKILKDVFFLTPVTTAIWLSFLAISAGFVYWFQWSWFLVPVFALGLLVLHEFFACIFGKGLFPSAERVARIYQFGTYIMGPVGDVQKQGDLTEGYFNGDFKKSIGQATEDKYDEVIKLLKLKKGNRVLDVGSGLGDFLFHLKSKGIEGVGLTVSPDQQAVALKRGLDVRLFDFRNDLSPDLAGQFDAVIFMGCLEHFLQIYSFINREQSIKVYAKAFESASKALSPQSEVQKVYSTTQHINKTHKWNLKDFIQAYILHGFYSGNYPVEGYLELASEKHFDVIHKYDATVDYQYSSMCCPQHFGMLKIDWNWKKALYSALLFFANPFSIMTWLYFICNTWIWQFGGSKIVPESQRPVKTLWYVYQSKNKNSGVKDEVFSGKK